ncbi:flagellar hook-associated protein 1 FlgK [Bartonella sp. AR 15-3]|nr:flagellar hook-associated protein 1 FlgK [Bartonella sp. AR 15-3]
MSLNLALNSARNSLKATTGRLDTVSRNVVRAGDPNYTRRTSYLESGPGGRFMLLCVVMVISIY